MLAIGFEYDDDLQTGFFGQMVSQESLRTLEGLTNVASKQTMDVDEDEVIHEFAVQTQLLT